MRTRSPQRAAGLSPRGFTLVEMVVVVAIVLVLIGLVLPAASTLWNERKRAGAVNTIRGLLMTTRARAMQAQSAEAGLFFFVDRQGLQRVVPIARLEPSDVVDEDGQPCDPAPGRFAYDNVFAITDGRDRVMPAPMRVVPRYVVDPEPTDKPYKGFSEAELSNNDFYSLPNEGNQAQRHRNYFAIVYSTGGHLLVNRDVLLIRDRNADPDENQLGDRTGLAVGPGPCPDDATTTEYYDAQADAAKNIDLDPAGGIEAVPFLVTDDDDVAINFRSVDGLLVYDDSLFNDVPTAEKRSFLLATAQPLYVTRYTGVVIRGPVGENVTP